MQRTSHIYFHLEKVANIGSSTWAGTWPREKPRKPSHRKEGRRRAESRAVLRGGYRMSGLLSLPSRRSSGRAGLWLQGKERSLQGDLWGARSKLTRERQWQVCSGPAVARSHQFLMLPVSLQAKFASSESPGSALRLSHAGTWAFGNVYLTHALYIRGWWEHGAVTIFVLLFVPNSSPC